MLNQSTPTSQSNISHGFRADIEGLRAIAVFGVLIFHLNSSWLPGGFIGVDVFYVISGFIITRQLLAQNAKGTFSFITFWIRRIKRLYPAMLSVILLTLIAGFWLITPAAYQETAESGLAAIFMSANIYFADRVGYFAPIAGTRELLHLWSLSFEQQFYLMISLLFFLKPSKKVILYTLTLVSICSFIACLILLEIKPDKTFYFPFGRFWEVAIGGLMAMLLWQKPLVIPKKYKTVAAIGAYFSLFILFLSFYLIRAEAGFPGPQTLAPVLSTAVLILLGSPTPALNFFLTNKVTRWHGRVSYTLYLVHWPVIVLMAKANPDVSPTAHLILSLAIIYAFTIAIHYLIEMPLRVTRNRPQSNTLQFASLFAATLAIVSYIYIDRGSDWRLTGRAASIYHHDINLRKKPGLACTPTKEYAIPRKSHLCHFGTPQTDNNFLIIGDSHMGMLAPTISSALLEQRFKGGLSLSLPPNCPLLVGVAPVGKHKTKICNQALDEITEVIKKIAPDHIYLVARWANFGSNLPAPGDNGKAIRLVEPADSNKTVSFTIAFQRTLNAFKPSKITVVGPVPEQSFDVPSTMIRSAMLNKTITPMPRNLFDQRQSIILETFRQLDKEINVIYPHEVLCDADICNYNQDLFPLYYDDDHLTTTGAELLRPLFTAPNPH